MTALETLRRDLSDINARIAVEQTKRGAAVADGSGFDDAELNQLRAKAEALNDAVATVTGREREETAAEIRNTRDRLRAELFKLEERRLGAVGDAEKYIRGYVASISEVLEISAEMRSICRRAKFETPMGLNEPAQVVRLGSLLSSVLKTIPRHPHRFGPVTAHTSHRKAADGWIETEARALSEALKHATEKELTNEQDS